MIAEFICIFAMLSLIYFTVFEIRIKKSASSIILPSYMQSSYTTVLCFLISMSPFLLYSIILLLTDWVTPDLLEIFQKNEVIKSGLKNAKCTAAMQMMQKDPKEASKRFQGDPEVDDFLREFGRVMSGHFEKLGNKKDVANSTNGIAKNDRTKCDGKMVKPMISESGSTAGSNSESKSRIIEIDRNLGGTKSAKSSAVPGTGSSSPYGILQSEALERHR